MCIRDRAKAEGAEQVILTDHNEFQQSVSDIAEVEVYGVVDHNRVANFETASPLYMRLEPVGSASVSYTHLDVYKRQKSGRG